MMVTAEKSGKEEEKAPREHIHSRLNNATISMVTSVLRGAPVNTIISVVILTVTSLLHLPVC